MEPDDGGVDGGRRVHRIAGGPHLLGRVADQCRKQRRRPEPAMRCGDYGNPSGARVVVEQRAAATIHLGVDEARRQPGAFWQMADGNARRQLPAADDTRDDGPVDQHGAIGEKRRAVKYIIGRNRELHRKRHFKVEQIEEVGVILSSRRAPDELMDTERHSPRYNAIDVWSPADILDAMIEGQFAAVAAVRAARPPLEGAVLAMEPRLRDGGRLIYAGAGTSGRLAVQDGAELVPTFSWPKEQLLLLIAGGREALVRSVEGAEDESDQAVGLVRRHAVDAADVLIAVAASGTTPFTLACLREAKVRGALTIGIANNRDTPLLLDAAHPVWLDTGPEPIAGSTRMKAGTAQRIALNLLSSLVMIRLGRVYQGLMVDLTAVNSKLVRRSERILLQLSGRSREEVRDALHRANGNVKIALLLLEGCALNEAMRALDRAGGQLRTARALIETRRSQKELP